MTVVMRRFHTVPLARGRGPWHPVSVMPDTPPSQRRTRAPAGPRRRSDPAHPDASSRASAARSPRARSRPSSASRARASYHLLATLEEHGFVVHLPAERRWGLGVAAFELGGGYARQEPLARLGRPLLAELVDRAGESAHLAVMTGRDVLYIVEERAPRRPALVTDVGVRLPAHLTAIRPGDARGAAPRAGARAVSRMPRPSPTAPAEVRGGPASCARCCATSARAATRSRTARSPSGSARSASPCRDHVGWPIAAIAVTYPTRRGRMPPPSPRWWLRSPTSSAAGSAAHELATASDGAAWAVSSSRAELRDASTRQRRRRCAIGAHTDALRYSRRGA